MTARRLFTEDSPVAQRQPKTDRLILGPYLKRAADDKRLDQEPAKGRACDPHQMGPTWNHRAASRNSPKRNYKAIFSRRFSARRCAIPGPADASEVYHRIQHHRIAGEEPDAVLGNFRQDVTPDPLAVVELKGPAVHPDRDRSNGRTAVDQCWDYLINTPPTCRWGHRLEHCQLSAVRTATRPNEPTSTLRCNRCASSRRSNSSMCCSSATG